MASISFVKKTDKKTTTTIIEYDDLKIETKYFESTKPNLTLYINGELNQTVDKADDKKTVTVTGAEKEHTITVWFKKTGSKIPFFRYETSGAGILLDDIPVQNTIADPFEYIKSAKSGLILFMLILAIKIPIVIYQNQNQQYENFSIAIIVSAISVSIFAIPLIILLILYKRYSSSPKTALIFCLIVGLLETTDYISGTVINYQNGIQANAVLVFFFIMLRLGALYAIIQGIRNCKKL